MRDNENKATERPISFLIGVFLICASGLMLQIVETRILSVISWYHLAFFAISMAMLGMTAGSLLVYFKPHIFPAESPNRVLSWLSAAVALSVAASTVVLITSVVPSGLANNMVMTAVTWLKLILVLLPPYVFLGMAVSLALTRSPWPVGLVYGTDLIGAASGCLLVLVLLEWADGISALFAVGALAAAGAVCFQCAAGSSNDAPGPLPGLSGLGAGRRPAMLAALLGAIAIGNAAVQPRGLVLLMVKNGLELEPEAILRWNTFSRIQVGHSVTIPPALWGPSPGAKMADIPQRHLEIDGGAATSMYQFGGDLAKADFLRNDLTTLAYTIRDKGRSAVIGVGGGRDVLSAYMFGFRDVTGVELNPIFIELLTGTLRDYSGIANLPGVRLIVDEARSWFARTPDRFDLIQMSLIDTWAATGAGAYSLSENGLYTAQGWKHFLHALTPSGVYTVSRWFNPKDVTETGRLFSLAAAALRNDGVADPEKHLFLAATDKLATLIVAKRALTQDEIGRLRDRVKVLHFTVLFSPDSETDIPILRQIVHAKDAAALAVLSAENHLDFSVTTDSRPFFFNQLNALDFKSIQRALDAGEGIMAGNLLASMTILLIMAISGLLAVFSMIVPALPSIRRTPAALAGLGTCYFFLTGLGFMFVEIGVIQRVSLFLGHPVHGLAIGLFSIILSTGIGAMLSERVPLSSVRRIAIWAVLTGCFVAALPSWFPVLVETFEGTPLVERALVSLLAIVPSGLLMGFGFPTGMRLIDRIDRGPTPWFWAINGAAGVLATSVAVATSIVFSIDVSLWIGAVCYLLIGVFGAGLRRLPGAAKIGL